jgi:hypothetical protein
MGIAILEVKQQSSRPEKPFKKQIKNPISSSVGNL